MNIELAVHPDLRQASPYEAWISVLIYSTVPLSWNCPFTVFNKSGKSLSSQSDGDRPGGAFAKVAPGRRVWRYPWQRAVRRVFGARAAETAERSYEERARGGLEACVGAAGAVKPAGNAAVSPIRRH